MDVRRTEIVIRPNIARVIFRPFEINSPERVLKIIGRVMALSEREIDELLDSVLAEFHGRHQKIRPFFLRRFEQVRKYLLTDLPISDNRRLLIGSYFSQEYSL